MYDTLGSASFLLLLTSFEGPLSAWGGRGNKHVSEIELGHPHAKICFSPFY